MQILSETLEQLAIGEPMGYRNLWVYPLLGEGAGTPGYYLLDEALNMKGFAIREASPGGSVPELLVENLLDRPVLLVDGEELVGAKQNRVLNLSILLPPRSERVIPVSCVEAGRWAYRTRHFESAARAQYAEARRKAFQVTESMEKRAKRRADQADIWENISRKPARMSIHSETEAMSDIYEQRQGHLNDYVTNVAAVAHQLGAVFTIGGRVAGMDLFDAGSTLRGLLPKLTRSYALDACEAGRQPAGPPGEEPVSAFLCRVGDGPVLEVPAVGLGHDLRLREDGIGGGALVHHHALVHLYAFPRDAGEVATGGYRSARIRR